MVAPLQETTPTTAPSRKRPRASPPPAGRAAPPPPAPLPPASTTSLPSVPVIPHTPLATLPLHPPSHYTSLAASSPSSIAFQQPFHLTSFSYSPTRELLLERERKDEALAVYREPRMGSDLNRGFEEAVWRKGEVDEGLDALLDTLTEFIDSDSSPPAAADLLSKISVITWRGMLTKLMLAVYECENVSQGRRGDGWEMNAMVVDGCLYLEESNPPAKLQKKAANESSYLLQSYYGYSFESYCTQHASSSSSHPSAPVPPPPAGPDSFEPPNTNVQWCSVVKTNLGGFRAIVGGEVDCVRPGAGKEGRPIGTRDFVELKTNLVIQSQRDEVNFERQKLLKHYVQSFLLGVPTVTVGFRTRPGILAGLQHFNTLEIPRLVRGKPHAWDPLACLSSAHSLLKFIHRTISSHPSSIAAETALAAPPSPSPSDQAPDPLPPYPVFRLSFSPSPSALGPAGVSVRELTQREVEEEVLGAKKKKEGEGQERVGFLGERWVTGVRERMRRRGEEAEGSEISSAVPSAPPPPSAVPAPPPSISAGRRVPPPPPPPPPASTPASSGNEARGSGSSLLAGLKR
ncbi:hypothetical protein JCM11251_003779 [Rhodosporidiobolus azoricus]